MRWSGCGLRDGLAAAGGVMRGAALPPTERRLVNATYEARQGVLLKTWLTVKPNGDKVYRHSNSHPRGKTPSFLNGMFDAEHKNALV